MPRAALGLRRPAAGSSPSRTGGRSAHNKAADGGILGYLTLGYLAVAFSARAIYYLLSKV
jgi:hypothetical protein